MHENRTPDQLADASHEPKKAVRARVSFGLAILAVVYIAAYGISGLYPDRDTDQNRLPTSDSAAVPPEVSPDSPNILQTGETIGDLKIAINLELGRNPLISDTGDCDREEDPSEGKESEAIRRQGWVVTSETSALAIMRSLLPASWIWGRRGPVL